MVQSLTRAALEFRINTLQHDSTRLSSGGEQHRGINRRFDRAHARRVTEARHQPAVVADSVRSDWFEVDVRGDAEQAIANRLTKSGVHRERDYQRRDACRHSHNCKQCNDSQHRRPVRRPQIPQRHEPFEAHFGSPLAVASASGGSSDSLRKSGKSTTSRIACESVSSITSRSMPTPSPAVGGKPCESARM